MKPATVAFLIPLLFATVAHGDDSPPPVAPGTPQTAPQSVDVIVLKDGRRLEGEVIAEDDRFVSLRSGGVTRAYAKDSIASITKAPRAASDPGTAPTPPASPGAEPPPKDKKKAKGERRDAPLSDAAKTWLDQLIARTADADEAVRRSVGAAIGAMGPQAIPAVRAAEAAAPEGPQKQFLGRLAGDMEARRDRRGRGEPGMPGQEMGPDGAMPGQEPGMPPQSRFGGPRRAVEEMMQRLSADLELRDDQKPKVESVLSDAMKKRFELFRDARREGLTAEHVAERVTPLRTELLAQMKTVLDAPQYVLFEDMAQRLFDAQPRGPGQAPPPAPPPAKPETPPTEPAK